MRVFGDTELSRLGMRRAMLQMALDQVDAEATILRSDIEALEREQKKIEAGWGLQGHPYWIVFRSSR